MLRKFYSEVRTKKTKSFFQRSTYIGFRASLSRHLQSPPFNRLFTIVGNPNFASSNRQLDCLLRYLSQQGYNKPGNIPGIEPVDIDVLRGPNEAFDLDEPSGLQRKVWFDIHFNFARRGNQNDRGLTKNSFVLRKDAEGFEYLSMAYQEATTNHPGGVKQKINPETSMYGNGTHFCPLAAFLKYTSKLHPDCESLWQRPKLVPQEFKTKEAMLNGPWYRNTPVGKNTLSVMMTNISKLAHLSQLYTNHGVRGGSINTLSAAGVEGRLIQHVTHHKNPSSLLSYQRDSSSAQKRQHSAYLQGVPITKPSSSTFSSSTCPTQLPTINVPACSTTACPIPLSSTVPLTVPTLNPLSTTPTLPLQHISTQTSSEIQNTSTNTPYFHFTNCSNMSGFNITFNL